MLGTMSTHIGAKPGEIAPFVLLPGDPLRAKWIAETFLENAQRYSDVRNMLGYTGTYRGQAVSVQGTGMGMPSASIYVNELITEYDVQSLVRVGSCGGIASDLKMRDLVIASGACTDSRTNRLHFDGHDYAPVADYSLLRAAADAASPLSVGLQVGLVFSSDSFYHPQPDLVPRLAEYGVLAIDMETSAIYTLAAKHRRKALSIVTVSDHVVTGEELSAIERQDSLGDMVEVALTALFS